MPPATAELMLGFFDALDSHDEEGVLALVEPDVQFTSLIQEVEGAFRGHDGVRTYLHNLYTAFPDMRVAVEEIFERKGATVVRVRARAAVGGGGAHVDFTDWLAMTARHGRATWWAFFHTKEEALAAVGDRLAADP
jgi:ketosteroid isomerase-like protein